MWASELSSAISAESTLHVGLQSSAVPVDNTLGGKKSFSSWTGQRSIFIQMEYNYSVLEYVIEYSVIMFGFCFLCICRLKWLNGLKLSHTIYSIDFQGNLIKSWSQWDINWPCLPVASLLTFPKQIKADAKRHRDRTGKDLSSGTYFWIALMQVS